MQEREDSTEDSFDCESANRLTEAEVNSSPASFVLAICASNSASGTDAACCQREDGWRKGNCALPGIHSVFVMFLDSSSPAQSGQTMRIIGMLTSTTRISSGSPIRQ
jgi:hypothetical protein